jgi:flagellar motor protein MotB
VLLISSTILRAAAGHRRGDTAADDEGDGYLVSVSDLMIGLLFVFLLMLMAFVVQYRQSEHDLRQETVATQQERDRLRAEREGELVAARQERDHLRAELLTQRTQVVAELAQEVEDVDAKMREAETQRRQLLDRLEARLRELGVPVQIDAGSGVLRLPEGVLFRPMSADLSDQPAGDRPSRREAVRRLGAALAEVVPCYAAASPSFCQEGRPILETVFIEGHTDKHPVAPGARYADNYELSTARACHLSGAARLAPGLAELRNPAGERLLGLSGYGEDRPVRPGDREEDLAANRRIDIRFLLAIPPPADLDALRERLRREMQAPLP